MSTTTKLRQLAVAVDRLEVVESWLKENPNNTQPNPLNNISRITISWDFGGTAPGGKELQEEVAKVVLANIHSLVDIAVSTLRSEVKTRRAECRAALDDLTDEGKS